MRSNIDTSHRLSLLFWSPQPPQLQQQQQHSCPRASLHWQVSSWLQTTTTNKKHFESSSSSSSPSPHLYGAALHSPPPSTAQRQRPQATFTAAAVAAAAAATAAALDENSFCFYLTKFLFLITTLRGQSKCSNNRAAQPQDRPTCCDG